MWSCDQFWGTGRGWGGCGLLTRLFAYLRVDWVSIESAVEAFRVDCVQLAYPVALSLFEGFCFRLFQDCDSYVPCEVVEWACKVLIQGEVSFSCTGRSVASYSGSYCSLGLSHILVSFGASGALQ